VLNVNGFGDDFMVVFGVVEIFVLVFNFLLGGYIWCDWLFCVL